MSDASPVSRAELAEVLGAVETEVVTRKDLVAFADLLEQQIQGMVTKGKREAGKLGPVLRVEVIREDFHVPGVGTLPLATELVIRPEGG